MENSAMAKNLNPEEEKLNSGEDRHPDPQEWAPRPPRKADGNDQRESGSESAQEHNARDGDSADPETGR